MGDATNNRHQCNTDPKPLTPLFCLSVCMYATSLVQVCQSEAGVCTAAHSVSVLEVIYEAIVLLIVMLCAGSNCPAYEPPGLHGTGTDRQ